MAFRVMRNKRNQRWTQRLQEIFQVDRENNAGSMSMYCSKKKFRIYDKRVILGVGQISNWFHQSGHND